MKIRMETYEVDVPAAATPVTIKKSGQSSRACEVWLQAKSTNAADDMLMGTVDGQFFPVKKGQPLRLQQILNRMSSGYDFELSDIFVKAGTNGDDVQVLLMVRDEIQ